jgi:hypothetical protein
MNFYCLKFGSDIANLDGLKAEKEFPKRKGGSN